MSWGFWGWGFKRKWKTYRVIKNRSFRISTTSYSGWVAGGGGGGKFSQQFSRSIGVVSLLIRRVKKENRLPPFSPFPRKILCCRNNNEVFNLILRRNDILRRAKTAAEAIFWAGKPGVFERRENESRLGEESGLKKINEFGVKELQKNFLGGWKG